MTSVPSTVPSKPLALIASSRQIIRNDAAMNSARNSHGAMALGFDPMNERIQGGFKGGAHNLKTPPTKIFPRPLISRTRRQPEGLEDFVIVSRDRFRVDNPKCPPAAAATLRSLPRPPAAR